MDNQKQYAGFSAIAIIVALFFGLYLGKSNATINPSQETTEIISCHGYEEEFLKTAGYENRGQCKQLNIFLHQQYLEECLSQIKSTSSKENDRGFLDLCVYHLFAKDSLLLSSEYLFWRDSQ